MGECNDLTIFSREKTKIVVVRLFFCESALEYALSEKKRQGVQTESGKGTMDEKTTKERRKETMEETIDKKSELMEEILETIETEGFWEKSYKDRGLQERFVSINFDEETGKYEVDDCGDPSMTRRFDNLGDAVDLAMESMDWFEKEDCLDWLDEEYPGCDIQSNVDWVDDRPEFTLNGEKCSRKELCDEYEAKFKANAQEWSDEVQAEYKYKTRDNIETNYINCDEPCFDINNQEKWEKYWESFNENHEWCEDDNDKADEYRKYLNSDLATEDVAAASRENDDDELFLDELINCGAIKKYEQED